MGDTGETHRMNETHGRVPYLDNAKLAMMYSVVFGHLLEATLKGSQAHLHLTWYLLLYVFNVPVWVFLAGVTSKAETAIAGASRLLSVLMVFQLLYLVLSPGFRRETPYWIVTPWWILWFLLSLSFWKLLLPLALRIRWPIAVSVAIALGAGWFGIIGRPLSLSRTLVWFPMFLAGHLYGKALMVRIEKAALWMRGAALACLAASGLVLWLHPIDAQILYEAGSYSSMGLHPIWVGVAFRAGHMAAACMLGLCVLCLIPKSGNKLTHYGTRTLAILTLHPLVVRVYAHAVGSWSVLGWVPVMIVLAAGVTWLTGAKPLYRLVNAIYMLPQWLMDRRWSRPLALIETASNAPHSGA
jgi:fucose 4-O-acetylase-like acetyltransferase